MLALIAGKIPENLWCLWKADIMGSTGTGRFSDYPGTTSGSAKGKGTGLGNSTGPAQGDQCERALRNVPLEEVGRCEYLQSHSDLLIVGMSVSVRTTLVGGRLGVEISGGGEVIGLLPTEYNYLLQCMKQGYTYMGQVKSARLRPVPVVRVDLEPNR